MFWEDFFYWKIPAIGQYFYLSKQETSVCQPTFIFGWNLIWLSTNVSVPRVSCIDHKRLWYVEESLTLAGIYYQDYSTSFSLCVYPTRIQTSTCSHSPLAMVSLLLVSSMTALTSGRDWELRTTGMLKTGGKGKMHHGNDMVPGNQEVVMVQDDKQGGMREFLL